ncbi:MAG: type II secretion system GspH family protein [Kiritimatiellaeota bacterium]|nr:type II secretion system GspH family protein [Kiritimatiellota bacterium]
MRSGKRGFTLIELLLVIAVMAVLATLALGGVMAIIRNTREKRIDSMCNSLGLALMSYRTQEECWPIRLDPGPNATTVTFREEENAEVFKPLIDKKGYLSAADYLTKINGRGKTASLRMAIDGVDEKGKPLPNGNKPLGYPNPRNPGTFHFFNVVFNLRTDSVKVTRSH